jgi:hypothetical protein
MYFYVCYGGLKGMSLSDWENLSLRRAHKFYTMMQEQQRLERKEAEKKQHSQPHQTYQRRGGTKGRR